MHRDIKPENIVLTQGVAKLCDFGWATKLDSGHRSTFCGTPLFASPQLLNG
jgi:serine/threonine protein kinase